MKTFLSTAVLTLCTGVALMGCSRQAAEPEAHTGPSNLVHLDQDTFATQVEQAEGIVVVDFWASWCGPCLKLAPTLEKLAGDYQGRVKIGKVNIDENEDLADRFKVRSIPLLVLFKDGKAIDQSLGLVSESTLRAWFDKHL